MKREFVINLNIDGDIYNYKIDENFKKINLDEPRVDDIHFHNEYEDWRLITAARKILKTYEKVENARIDIKYFGKQGEVIDYDYIDMEEIENE